MILSLWYPLYPMYSILFGPIILFFILFFGGLECVGHCFAYVAHFVFLRDGWIRTQRAAVAIKRATQLRHPSS
jgi:hypothetical protein